MRLTGMVECLDQLASPDTTGLTTVDVVKMITDREWERRRNTKLARLRRAAELAQPHADVTDLRTLPDRNVDTDLVGRLAVGNYIAKHEDLIVLGPTGSGKTYVACALGNKAAQQYKSVLYLRAVDLFDRLDPRRTRRQSSPDPGQARQRRSAHPRRMVHQPANR